MALTQRGKLSASHVPLHKISILNAMREIREKIGNLPPEKLTNLSAAATFILTKLQLVGHAIAMLRIDMKNITNESVAIQHAIHHVRAKELTLQVEQVSHHLEEIKNRLRYFETNYNRYMDYWETVKKTNALPTRSNFNSIPIVDVMINLFQEEIHEAKIEKKQNLQLWKLTDLLFTHYAQHAGLWLDKRIFD